MRVVSDNIMSVKKLIGESILRFPDNGIFIRHLIPSEKSPLDEMDICGCWLLVFKSKKLMTSWSLLYETLIKVVNSNPGLRKVIHFEKIHKINERVLCLNRGFNQAYTTDSYAEFIAYGDRKPNDLVVQHLDELKKVLDQAYDFQFESYIQKNIIEGLIEKAFVEPNLELKWTNEPFPWTLYIPPISLKDINKWNKNEKSR